MSDIPAQNSIHLLPPLERGGVVARHGFDVQDHVAAGFLIEMLAGDDSLKQVWCETHDDITLIRQSREDVEFVQVKSEELDQLWSTAKLSDREKSAKNQDGYGTSILERSLANDRCSEPRRFRIVTCRPVQDDLKILTYPLDSEYRVSSQSALSRLEAELQKRVGDFRSPNGNGHTYWLSRVVWDERHSLESIANANLLKLHRLVESEGESLFSDQTRELYTALLTRARDAATTDWRDAPAAKKIIREDLLAWFKNYLTRVTHPLPANAGAKVREKMQQAELSTDMIETALEERRRYREEVLKPQYLKVADRQLIEDEVAAMLQELRSQLDAGELDDSGVEFHARCLRQLAELQQSVTDSSRPPLSFLHGCMYNIAGRCLHRFRRIAV